MSTPKNSPPLGNYRHHPRRFHTSEGPDTTKQEFKDDCDINRILSRFQRTGAISHFAQYGASYGDFPACDYQTAQNTLLRAREMYAALPSSIRTEFPTPDLFLDFVQNKENLPRMRELGLANPRPAAPPPSEPPPTP